MGSQVPECPPSYDQATGTYPTQPGGYPTQPAGYPAQQGGYPTQQGGYPTQQGGYPAQPGGYPIPQDAYESKPGAYPTTQPTYPAMQVAYPNAQGAYPMSTPAMPISQPLAPVTPMEREPARTVCDGCHNQVVTSVNSSLNGSAIGWIVYSLCCCWCYGFFLLCMDHFKTWKHSCPNCRKVLKEYTPSASGGTIACLVCAIVVNVILAILFIIGKVVGEDYDYDY